MRTFLTSNNNVGRDILDSSNSRFRGSMDAIQKWIQGFDYVFQCFVTFIGFGIICAAIGKNCLAGLYCTFPKFFDKVDAAHKEHENEGWVDQIRGLRTSYNSINGATLGKIILRVIPNIKVITDFEDSTVSAKDYFIKAIPLMCVAIIIGGFIYNGFHADVGTKITDFGSELFNRTIMATDPIEVFDKITNSLNRPTFASAGSDQPADKMVTSICTDAFATIKSRWPDMSGKTTVATIGSNIESWVLSSTSTLQEGPGDDVYSLLLNDPEGWKVETDVKIIETELDLSKYRRDTVSDNTQVKMYADLVDIMEGEVDLKEYTAKDDGESHYLMYIVKCTKIATEVKSGSCNDIVLTAQLKSDGTNYLIYLGGSSSTTTGNGAWAYTASSKPKVTINGNTCDSLSYDPATACLKVSKTVLNEAYGGTVKANEDIQINIQNLYWQQTALKSKVKTVILSNSDVTWSSETYSIGETPGEVGTFTSK